MEKVQFRQPLDKMSTTARCKWFAFQLGETLPTEHQEVQAFVKAYHRLENPIMGVLGLRSLYHDIGYIEAVIKSLENIGGKTEQEQIQVLKDAITEMKKYDMLGEDNDAGQRTERSV